MTETVLASSSILSVAATGAAAGTVQRQVLRDLLDAGAECTPEEVLTALRRRVGIADEATVARVRARLRTLTATTTVVGDETYPPQLADAWPELGAPLWLFVTGTCAFSPRRPAVAVVGTRAPTLDGARTAHALGIALAEAGVVVVSGLARGIDQAAHRGALDGGGQTIAVLGTGLGVDYPARSAALRSKIARSGALVTELPPGDGPRAWRFLERNRIISGMADATVVVEGRHRSGALQTARLAGGQGRDVWAVPGSINAPTSAAPLSLLRDGAIPLTSIEDFVATVTGRSAMAVCTGTQVVPAGLSPTAAALLPLLGPVPSSTDALAAASTLPAHLVMAAISELVERGAATVTPQGVTAL